MGGIGEAIIIGAAIGAGVGAATAIVTGGNPLKGALFGAIGGAVTAGVGSAFGGAADAAVDSSISESADATNLAYGGTTDTVGDTFPDVAPPSATDVLTPGVDGAAPNLATTAAENPAAINELGQPVVNGTAVPSGPGPGGASGGSQLAEATPTAGPQPEVATASPGGTAAAGAPNNIIGTNAPTLDPESALGPGQTMASPQAEVAGIGSSTPDESPSWASRAVDTINKNSGVATLGGGLINGLGQGIAGTAQASAIKNAAAVQAQNATNLAQEGQGFVTGNYALPSTGSGGLLNPTPPASGLPTPQQRFDPRSYGGQYQFNAQTGTIDFVKNTGAQPIGAPSQAGAPTPQAVAIGAGGQAGTSGAGA